MDGKDEANETGKKEKFCLCKEKLFVFFIFSIIYRSYAGFEGEEIPFKAFPSLFGCVLLLTAPFVILNQSKETSKQRQSNTNGTLNIVVG